MRPSTSRAADATCEKPSRTGVVTRAVVVNEIKRTKGSLLLLAVLASTRVDRLRRVPSVSTQRSATSPNFVHFPEQRPALRALCTISDSYLELPESGPVVCDGAKATRVGSAVRREDKDRACAQRERPLANGNRCETSGHWGRRAAAPTAGMRTHPGQALPRQQGNRVLMSADERPDAPSTEEQRRAGISARIFLDACAGQRQRSDASSGGGDAIQGTTGKPARLRRQGPLVAGPERTRLQAGPAHGSKPARSGLN